MKLLFVIPSYKPAFFYGGPIRSIAALCESLVENGNEVNVVTTTANGEKELDVKTNYEYVINGVQVKYFHRWTKDHTHFSPALLKYIYFNVKKYDVIHIHSWWNLVTIPATLICRMKGMRPVLSPRGSITHYTIFHRKTGFKRFLHLIIGRKLLEGVFIHSTSVREDKEVADLIQNNRRYIIPNLLELPKKHFEFTLDNTKLRLVFLGRIDRVKNLEYLLEELNENVKVPIHLSIAGEGEVSYVDSLKQIVSPLYTIDWMGEVDGDKKFKLLAKMDLLVLPSHTENFGNVVIEALSQGTPVLISDNVGAKDYVLENALGWVVKTIPGFWAEKIHDIWKDKVSLPSFRQKAKACIERDFNHNSQFVAYLNLYTDAMRASKRLYT